jgi:CBS domain-containing protein
MVRESVRHQEALFWNGSFLGGLAGMIVDGIVEFLGKVPPFQLLNRKELVGLASEASREFYPKGLMVLRQGDPPGEALWIVEKGGVKVWMETEGRIVSAEHRGPGELFGFLSLLSGDKSRANVQAVEDTTALMFGKNAVLRYLEAYPALKEHLLRLLFRKCADVPFSVGASRAEMYGNGDRKLFTTPVGALVSQRMLTAPRNASIAQAAARMAEAGTSFLLLTDDHGSPEGIVTDRDLRTKVVAQGRDPGEAAAGIMTSPLVRIEAQMLSIDALLAMLQRGIHHLLVMAGEKPLGVVTDRDLMVLQGSSPLSLVRDVESLSSLDEVYPAAQRLLQMIHGLVRDEIRTSTIMKMVAEMNDRLLAAVLRIAHEQLGPPPLSYCWIVFGSEGRKEQTFRTDQDNAIIYADPTSNGQEREAAAYFQTLATFANNALIRAGFPPCPGGYMASNEQWRRPFSAWRGYFNGWIATPTPDAILASVILFDFRGVYGDLALADDLRITLAAEAREHDIFLKQMADLTVRVRPPLGLFGNIIVERKGDHRRQVNLKNHCIAPLVNIARLFALEAGITQTSTLERLAALADLHPTVREFGAEISWAFEHLSSLRIRRQCLLLDEGKAPDNHIDPRGLTPHGRRQLKNACRLIGRVQDAIRKQYSPGEVL